MERLEGGKAYYSSRPQQRGPQRGAPPPGDLRGANLGGAILNEANLAGANLVGACLGGTYLSGANLSGSDLTRANLPKANFLQADLSGANLSGADLSGSNFLWAHLGAANLTGANLIGASFLDANLSGADLSGSDLLGSNLVGANLRGANLRGVNLRRATLVDANLADADLTGCHIYGISAWNLKLSPDTKQQGLIITPFSEPKVTVDDLEVAQFVYLLLHNEKIRHVIDTVGKKGVLLLGRFTEGRLVVLERLRDELRKRGYLPIVFNFDKPETKDFTETVRLLAGMSKFVIVDLTSPKSAPYELGAIVSQTMIPFQPIIEAGETPFALLRDLLTSYPDRVFQPIEYPSVDRLVETMDAEIIEPAETRFNELVMRRAETLKVRRV